jgi:hypothetical protein
MKSHERTEIRQDFHDFYDELKEDEKSSTEAVSKLAISGASQKDPDAAKRIVFKSSIVKLLIRLSWLMIRQAEYCDYYISKNEECIAVIRVEFREQIEELKASHQKEIDSIKSKVNPLIEIKRDFLGVANLASMAKKSPLKLLEWGSILAAANYLHLFDSVPKL